MANGLAFGEAVLRAVWAKSGRVVSVVTTDAIVGLRTLDGDSINRGDVLAAPPHSHVPDTVMKSTRSTRQRLLPPLPGAALARTLVSVSAFAVLSVAACSDGPFNPPERQLAAGSPQAARAPQHRPFQISQSWDPSGNDWTVPPCVVDVPNPAIPGETIQIVISRLLHSSGTATHFGRYTADNYAMECTWDPGVGAIDIGGWVRAVVASGDTVWGTWQSYASFGGTGADFDGVMWLEGGTGRFRGATGMASMHTHDEPDGSGSGSGSGWIAY